MLRLEPAGQQLCGAGSSSICCCICICLHGVAGCVLLVQVVLFVDRGVCTFAAKVEAAQSCGADAVVVVDHGTQDWTRGMIRHNIIMSDDGKVRRFPCRCVPARRDACTYAYVPFSRVEALTVCVSDACCCRY